MIGLKRGTVYLSDYQSSWSLEFEKEKKRLLNDFRDIVVDIQHIGSTSIPGMKAKPIIDIAIGLKTMRDSEKLIAVLKKRGYEYRPFGNVATHKFFAKGPESKRTHYIHVVKHRGVIWNRDLFFRDYLSSHKRDAQKYIKLKEKLARAYADDRASYTALKSEFVKSIFAKLRK